MEVERHRINLDEYPGDEYAGQWVDIRKRLSLHRLNEFDLAGLKRRPAEAGAPVLTSDDVNARDVAQLETVVLEWSLPWPCDRSGFESEEFDGFLAKWIIDQIRAYYDTLRLGPDERGNFRGRSTPR